MARVLPSTTCYLPGLAPRLLRGHVSRRAQHRVRVRLRAVLRHQLRQPKVRQVGHAVGVEQNVARLDVAVQHAALMGVMDRAGDGGDEVRGVARGSVKGLER